jgi:peptidoglycan/LPS O-acetylase OafA/YrhL
MDHIHRAAHVTEDDETQTGRRRRRRRVAAQLAPVGVVLLVIGVVFADDDGALGAIGLAALAQGIGLAVALLWLAAGHNPLSRG